MKCLHLLLPIALFYSNAVKADQIDVMHFWVSPGERNALQVFIDAYENMGHQWIDDVQEDGSTLRANALARIADGYPPTAIHWHVSNGLEKMADAGILTTFDEPTKPQSLSQLHPILLNAVTKNKKIVAIPVGIHAENWSYYNAKIMNSLNLKPPTNWEEFFEQMLAVEEAGYKTIVMGSQWWEVDIVFRSMIAATGGIALTNAIRSGELNSEQEAQLEKAFGHLIQFRDIFKRSGLPRESWDMAADAVRTGQATVQIMGDWVKAEMIFKKAKPEQDFLCAMAPGNENTYLMAIDTFILPLTYSEEDKKGQLSFIDTVLNRNNQIEFSRNKGTIPVRKDIDKSQLDICGQIGYAVFQKEGATEISLIENTTSSFITSMESVVKMVWRNELSDPTLAMNEFLKQMNIIKGI